jgi:hypothetical protein
MTIVLEPATFVLQRRIVRPFAQSQCTIANPAVFGPGCVLAEGPSGSLVLDGVFRRIVLDPRATWIAEATLATPRGRRIAAVQVEIGPWSADDTELLLRPVARAPHLWSGHRLRRYFAAAHAAADALTALLLHGDPVRVHASLTARCRRLGVSAPPNTPLATLATTTSLATEHPAGSEALSIHVQPHQPR